MAQTFDKGKHYLLTIANMATTMNSLISILFIKFFSIPIHQYFPLSETCALQYLIIITISCLWIYRLILY